LLVFSSISCYLFLTSSTLALSEKAVDSQEGLPCTEE